MHALQQLRAARWVTGRTLLATMSVVVASASVAACSGAGRYVWVQNHPVSSNPQADIIQRGDTVAVRVFGQEAMSVTGRVRPNGVLAIPLLGEYPVAGRRPSELAGELEKRLQPYVTAAKVTVVIEQSPVRVTVMGEVGKAGHVTLERPATVLDALAEGGGITPYADEDRVFVLRRDERIRFTYDQLTRGDAHARNFLLENGDVVVVE